MYVKSPIATSIRTHRDFVGSCIGLFTFLGGIGLLVIVFRLAYEMFTIPPPSVLGISKNKNLDLNVAGNSLATVFIKILLLLVMGLVGSWIANRGISLYTQARSIKMQVEEE